MNAMNLCNYEKKIRSQFGEDGIIEEILRRIEEQRKAPIVNPHATEIGAGPDYGNTHHLIIDKGWSGTLIEADKKKFDILAKLIEHKLGMGVDLICETILPEHMRSLVPRRTNVLSIDIDSNDFWLWYAADLCRPELVIVEINGNFAPPVERVSPYDPDYRWDGSDHYGASLQAWLWLGSSRGYRLIGTTSDCLNAFFVRADVAGGFQTYAAVDAWRQAYKPRHIYPTSGFMLDLRDAIRLYEEGC